MDERNQNAALIGSSGFVGQTLSKQAHFSHHFRSTNIGNIDGGTFDTVVCSAAPAQKKWIANREPPPTEKKYRWLDRTSIDHPMQDLHPDQHGGRVQDPGRH